MKRVPIHPKLLPYYKRMTELLEHGDRASVILPTGTGKSHFILRYIQTHRPQNVLFITSQTAIQKDFNDKMSQYEILIPNFRQTLYCSLSYQMKKGTIGQGYNMIILDEYRHSGAALAEQMIYSILEMNFGAKILGMDATPVRYLDKRGPKDMTDPLFQGYIAVEIDLYEAFATGLLVKPDYLSCCYDLSAACPDYLLIPGNEKYRFSFYHRLHEKARRSLDIAKGLNTIFAKHLKYPSGKYIVFCRNRLHMDQMIIQAKNHWFNVSGIIPTIYWDCSNCESHPNDYNAFNKDNNKTLRLLFCINMFNEGIHLNTVDGVILLRPTSSPNILYQQIGRCMSIMRNDRQPQIIDLVMNLEELQMRQDLFHLRSITDAGLEKIDKNTCTNPTEPETAPSSSEARDELILESFRIEYIDCDMTRILLEMKNSLSHSPFLFEIGLNVARKYRATHSDLNVMPGEYYLGFPLGDWLQQVRSRRWSKGLRHLHENKIKEIDKLGIDWYFEPGWIAMYSLAKEYHDEFQVLPTSSSELPEKYKVLPGWLARQRGKRRGKIVPPLSSRQIKMLDDLGMIWDLRHPLDDWYQHYEKLLEAIKIYPDLNIPAHGETKELYYWLRLQLDYLSGKKPSPLNRNQTQLLDTLHLPERKKTAFQRNIDKIIEFKKEYGELPRSRGSRPQEKELYQWMRNQTRTANLQKMKKENKMVLIQCGILKVIPHFL